MNHGQDSGCYSFPVIWVKAGGPGFPIRTRISAGVTEQKLKPGIPPELVGPQIPIPNCIISGPRDELEALITFPQSFLRLALCGDVAETPDPADAAPCD